MRLSLELHPASRCAAVTRIDVDVARPRTTELQLRYVVTGKTDQLRLPAIVTPARVDELWRHTCFEVFIRPSHDEAYYEFNFAPSTQWAAYAFTGYRDRMAALHEIQAPRIEIEHGADQFELRAAIALAGLGDLSETKGWRLGLSAVIEETNGERSYWALAHPPGQADFHHADGFTYDLPAAEQK
jgi:hypothetical protein